MTEGSCLCGDVRWAIDGPVMMHTQCHCSMCRKAHGSAFATYVGIAVANFRWLSGESRIARYESSPGGVRPFCPRCGSVVPAVAGDAAFMPAGNLEGAIELGPHEHIFVGSKAPWYEIADDAPQYESYPPNYEAAEHEREERLPATSGAVGGSCLCGNVRFEFDGDPVRMGHCHCSRCRKSRSAAFSTQVFVPLPAFRWLAGRDRVRSFKVPDAAFFASAFCIDCGSPAPQTIEDIDLAMLPAGSLDQDPGMRPMAHIYVGSKAPWFEIGDALPQFEAMPPT